jgi:hypothetical protein
VYGSQGNTGPEATDSLYNLTWTIVQGGSNGGSIDCTNGVVDTTGADDGDKATVTVTLWDKASIPNQIDTADIDITAVVAP